MPYDNPLNRQIAEQMHKILQNKINHIPMTYEIADGMVGYANKKLIDDETLIKKREQQQKQEEVELNRINMIKERERREQEREEQYKALIDKEIQINN